MLVAILTWCLPHAGPLNIIRGSLAYDLDIPILQLRRLRHTYFSWFAWAGCGWWLEAKENCSRSHALDLDTLLSLQGSSGTFAYYLVISWLTQQNKKQIFLQKLCCCTTCKLSLLWAAEPACHPGPGPLLVVWGLELTWPVKSPAPGDWTPLPSPSSPPSSFLLCSLFWGNDSDAQSSEVFPNSCSLEY